MIGNRFRAPRWLRFAIRGLLGAWLIAGLPARAETVLDQIARTGVLHAGTRADAPPFAFRDKDGQLAGLSVDLIEAVRKALEVKLGRDVRTEFAIVTSANRLETVETGKAVLVCETATVTWSREQRVDFSLPIFRDGTRLLTYRETYERSDRMSGLRVGVVEGSVTGVVVKEALPGMTIVSFPSMLAALRGMESGSVDAIANVGIVLRALIPQASRQQGLAIVPRGEALGYENLACLLPENDSRWRDFVNGVLRGLFRGIDAYSGGYMDIYQRWFGRNAAIFYPLGERESQFFQDTMIWLD